MILDIFGINPFLLLFLVGLIGGIWTLVASPFVSNSNKEKDKEKEQNKD